MIYKMSLIKDNPRNKAFLTIKETYDICENNIMDITDVRMSVANSIEDSFNDR